MNNHWILVRNGKKSPMFAGFYFIEVGVYVNREDIFPTKYEITIAQYDPVEDQWILPKEYDHKKVVVYSYWQTKVKLPKRQHREAA